MPQARSLTSAYEIVDWTKELNELPNTYGLTQELGIFRNESVAQNTVQFEATKSTIGLVKDQFRGTRNNVSTDNSRTAHAYILAHFPLDDALYARELVGKRAYGSMDAAETEAAVIARKMERIRKSHAITAEVARVHTLVSGTQYAPNNTVSANFYTDFGVSRKVINFALAGTGATLVRDKSREAIDHIQTNILTGEMTSNHVALCSPTFFDLMVAQAGVIDAWKYAQGQLNMASINQNGFKTGAYDEITFGGIRYIRYLAYKPDGTVMIPDGEAYILPLGTEDTFVSYYGPAERFDTINTLGEEAYMWTERSRDETQIMVTSETNFVHLIRRPQCVVKATAAA
jgi:hypothetical protein